MRHDSVLKTVVVATLLCIICSIFVSYAAVSLKPLQEKNKILETKRNILVSAGLMEEGKSIEELFKKIKVKMVDISTGRFLEGADVTNFDAKKALKDPSTSMRIPEVKDIAKIKKRTLHSLVYLVEKDNQLETIILPIYGKGLWSTLYAFIAIKKDGNTVQGLSFYEHAETPGLGGEVDNPNWKKLWKGKKIYDENWKFAITLPKIKVDPTKPESIHQIDSLSGATLTARGVENLIHYWMGEDGFGPFLTWIRSQGGEA